MVVLWRKLLWGGWRLSRARIRDAKCGNTKCGCEHKSGKAASCLGR